MRTKSIIFNCLVSCFLPLTATASSTKSDSIVEKDKLTDAPLRCKEGICELVGGDEVETDTYIGVWKKNAKDALVFVWKRIPNTQEMFIDIVIQAPLDVALGSFTSQLGDNPSAKSFLRDLLKLPPTLLKAWKSVNIGSTGLVFDVSNVYSQVSKVAMKVGGILVFTHLGMNPEAAGTTANYLGDPLAKLFIKAGKDRQTEKSDLSFPRYLLTKFQAVRGMMSVAMEVGPKVLIVNNLGELIKYLGVTRRIKGLTIFIPPTGASPVRRLAYATMATFASTWVVTYMLAPAARVAQDSMSVLTDDYVYPVVMKWWKSRAEENSAEPIDL
ncbi:MAG: hypothetical protein HYW48_08725 [Deltaproteobacteria bacterium]|nr:hypothetical protein [Deltaproteobacteria bacterium]